MQTIDLAGAWAFRRKGEKKYLPAQVPGCVHTDLRREGKIPDPFWGANEMELAWIERADWEYRRTFEVSAEVLQNQNVELVCDGLDTLATVFVNGHKIAATENMFIGYRWSVKKYLQPGQNEIEIHFANPMDTIEARRKTHNFGEWCDPVGGSSNLRKEQCSFGWDWGPRFPTCGVYKDIYLQAWSVNRLVDVLVEQKHAEGQVTLNVTPESAKKGGAFRAKLKYNGEVVAQAEGEKALQLEVAKPLLWWPNGYGAQPLYDLEVELLSPSPGPSRREGSKISSPIGGGWVGGAVLDSKNLRIGLRTIELDRHADQWGESFQFVVNGLPIFAKGANWIPAHSFVTEVTREFYDDLLTSATQAHMNMLRVWGGGIYEMEAFYDLCDEKGILIWQDFMFACSLYPGDKKFLKSVEAEADFQVRRLRNRTCLALWCGNNELEQMPQEIVATPERKKAYEDVFYGILPHAVESLNPQIAYWPSSPHNPEGYEKGFNNENAGDCHFWDVWHARQPVKTYETKNFRFCSEFGMQSYSSPEVAATFCDPNDFNVFGPAMENHQKNGAGNLIIFDYVSRLYRFPKDFAGLSYLSQLNQAYCMKVGIEHFRRAMPRTMGALYWQLNDCWPVFSWSSIEFGGKWKALHFAAQKFFAPALVSAHVPGDETLHYASNRVRSTIHEVNVYTVYDGTQPRKAEVGWTLYHLDNRVLKQGRKNVQLCYGESILQLPLDFQKEIDKFGRRHIYLRIFLRDGDELLSQNTVFFTAPRYLEFGRETLSPQIEKTGAGRYELHFEAKHFHHQVMFNVPGARFHASDNFFDLYPCVPHVVELQLPQDLSIAQLKKRLEVMSYVDSY
jgi:beta-mannosidase